MIIVPRDQIPDLEELDITIETARMKLRPLVESDVDPLWPYVSDPALPRQMSWNTHASKDETSEWILRQLEARARGRGLLWGIEREGALVGCIGLSDIEWQQRAWRVDRAELGYWIAPALWGQGLMTEAALGVVSFGFDNLGLHKITVQCLADNAASRRVIEKCGFRFVGRREEDVWRDEKWHAHLCYELTISEWTDTTATRRFHRPPR
jgi:ribosomal-protein-alanine N-acetyltransferase